MRLLSCPATLSRQLIDSERRVLVTGASGWLGQACLEMLSQTFGPLFASRVLAFGSAPRTLTLRDGTKVPQSALSELSAVQHQPSILFHFAYLTKEKVESMTLAQYVERNRAISRMTETAAHDVGADRIFVTSSGAVYQAMAASASVESVHSYGALKLEDEALFRAFAAAGHHRKVLTTRLFNLSGPYINKLDSYALASFIEQARSSGFIDIKARHPVIRSYTGAENLLNVAIAHLLDDEMNPHVCMDTAGDRDVEVEELAEVVRSIVNPDALIRRLPTTPEGADRYVGNGALYHAMAARYGVELHSLDRQVSDTAAYLLDASAH